MQNFESTTSYNMQNHCWYSNPLLANIKTEPNSADYLREPQSPPAHTTQLNGYLVPQPYGPPLDSMTPSPSNNDSLHYFEGAPNMQVQQLQQQYQQQFQQAQQAATQHQLLSNPALPLGFNPLTPPYYTAVRNGANATATLADVSDNLRSVLTPHNTPPMDISAQLSTEPSTSNAAALRQRPPPSTSTVSSNSEALQQADTESQHSHSSEQSNEGVPYDPAIHEPVYNSHGKVKLSKCTYCKAVFDTKYRYFKHLRSHIKPGKRLTCDRCPFVTRYKHHIEYHMKLHDNVKPFKCDECQYVCVNKSMLVSHKKSHSIYSQFQCANCKYVSKHLHALKVHLKRSGHKPQIALDENGKPDPSRLIDVHGRKRGPKSKRATKQQQQQQQQQQDSNGKRHADPNESLETARKGPTAPSTITAPSFAAPYAAALQRVPPQKPLESTATVEPVSVSNFLQPLALFQFMVAQQHAFSQISPDLRDSAFQQLRNLQNGDNDNNVAHQEEPEDEAEEEEDDTQSEDSAMDLSRSSSTRGHYKECVEETEAAAAEPPKSQNTNDATPAASTSRRKGRVLKLDVSLQAKSASQSPEPKEQSPQSVTGAAPAAAANNAHTPPSTPPHSDTEADNKESTDDASNNSSAVSSTASASSSSHSVVSTHECKHCDIIFKNEVLYTIHMGCHSCDDAYKCNMCGKKCADAIEFSLHMTRNAHH